MTKTWLEGVNEPLDVLAGYVDDIIDVHCTITLLYIIQLLSNFHLATELHGVSFFTQKMSGKPIFCSCL